MDENSLSDMKTLHGGSEDEKARVLSNGDTVGEYQILDVLGKGGMGEVYLAENTLMHKKYALKVLPPDLSSDSNFIARFKIEARVMSDLNHPNIVHVNYIGSHNGLYYLVMDFVGNDESQPQTLEDLLQEKGKLSEQQTIKLLKQICSALDYAHNHRGDGVVHRDLKPANILIDHDGSAKIADFGLAKLVGDEYLHSIIDQSMRLTMAGGTSPADMSLGDMKTMSDKPQSSKRSTAGSLLGTYEYMAPEQQEDQEATVQSDIYSLGLILYRMLTGRKAKGRFKLPSELGCSKKWDAVIDRCLEHYPQDRFKSAQDILVGLTVAKSSKFRWVMVALTCVVIGGGIMVSVTDSEKVEPVQIVENDTQAEQQADADRLAREKLALAEQNKLALEKIAQEKKAQREESARLKQQQEEGTRIAALKKKQGNLPGEGENWTVPGLNMDFVYVDNGSFQMGSNSGDADEKPVHRVTISKPFWMGKYEVTQSEYQELMGSNPSHFKGSRNPVEIVSWNDVVSYCQKLTARERRAGRLPEGYSYQLPTEAQWKFAARGGNKSRGYMYSGSDSLGSVGWNGDNSGSKTHSVGQKQANELGLYDMSGNVYEWCYDWYGSYSSSSTTDPDGPSSASGRVIRGGGWAGGASDCRAAVRSSYLPDYSIINLGFRVCLSPSLQ